MKRSLLIICIALFLCAAVSCSYVSDVVGGIFGVNDDNIQSGNPDFDPIVPDDNNPQLPDNSGDAVIPDVPDEEITEDTTIEGSATGDVADVLDEKNALASSIQLVSDNGIVSATLPEGALLADGVTELKFSVKELDVSAADITVSEYESSISLDVHIEGLSAENESVIKVYVKALLPVGLNMGNYNLYHVENGETILMTLLCDEEPVHNSFEYDPVTGDTTMYLKSFSEIALVSNEVNPWEGNLDYSWFTAGKGEYTIANADQLAAFSAIVGGMSVGKDAEGNLLFAHTYTETEDGVEYTYHNYSFAGETLTLIADINLGDDEANNNSNIIFYPIGYWNSEETYERTNTDISSGFYTFEGTFNGNGNTIKNFYQNTWEMKGDHDWYSPEEQYYRDGMGLFGKVYGGTVKNLTVANFSSDGEITTTGVIAAYADSVNGRPAVFENITIFNCNPRVYNIGNGGIVGCAGWYSKNESLGNKNFTNAVTFKNITVDQSNMISALWGTYDVSCGGILGQYYPDSGCGIKMENCHVAAIMDVHNDVCANYQYYWYRYSGMFIGTIRANTKDSNGYTVADTTGIIAKNCTYTLGDWNEYWYCELVANSLASYTHDHQFSRLTKISSVSEIQDTEGNWNKEGNFVIPNADNTSAVCYHIFKDSIGNLYQHFHDVADETNPDIYESFDLNGDGEINDLKEDRSCYFMPFNQVLCGIGYGVKAHYQFDNIENVVGDGNSYVKFKDNSINVYGNGVVTPISKLFAESGQGTVSSPTVQVYVSPIGEYSTVTGTYSADVADWENGTLTFLGTGLAKVVITDYFYCTETVITVIVQDTMNISIGDKSFDVAGDRWLYNVQKASGDDASDYTNACYYDALIYDKSFNGVVTTNDSGVAIVLDKYGILREIYDAKNLAYWTSTNKGAAYFTVSNYASYAFNEIQDGETLIIFPSKGDDVVSTARDFGLSLRGTVSDNGTTATNIYIGKSMVLMGTACDEVCPFCGKCVDFYCQDPLCKLECPDCFGVIVDGDKSDVSTNVIRIDVPNPALTDNTFLVYSYGYKKKNGTITLNNAGGVAFIVDDVTGKVLRIYDGANATYYDADNLAGVSDASKCTSSGYLQEALASLSEGEYILAAPNTGGNISRVLMLNNLKVGALVHVSSVQKLDVRSEGTHVFEAENLDFSNLTAPSGQTLTIEVPTTADPVTSGGRSLGYCNGGYSTFTLMLHDKATVLISARLAYKDGGNAADFIAINVDGINLITEGSINKGITGSNLYWNWTDIIYGGLIDLEPGLHTITVTVKQNMNIDCFKVDVRHYGEFHKVCEFCGECNTDDCDFCDVKCKFLNKNNVITFAPNASYIATPEGPDGIEPGESGAYIYDRTIGASQVILDNGAHATLVTLPGGTTPHSGLSFWNNQYVDDVGKTGYNCAVPTYAGIKKDLMLHFENTGTSEITFIYSAVNYYYNKGEVELTLAPGEKRTVILVNDFENDVVGLNHQFVFPNGADAGAAVTVWGEYIADELESIFVSVPATKLVYNPGEVFSADGLVLQAVAYSPTNNTKNQYERVYISTNYITNFDGYMFTEADALAGKKTVTVTFAGKTTTYEISINNHIHMPMFVATTIPVLCKTNGVAEHYKCECGAYFADEEGTVKIPYPEVISCHTAPSGAILPGQSVICTACGNSFMPEDMSDWVLLNLTTNMVSIGSNIKNGKAEQTVVNGLPGTKFYIGAGTVGATPDSSFYLKMHVNDPGRQTVIPNLGANAGEGEVRRIVLYYENYSNVDITMNLQNDQGGSFGYCPVTIPANGTAVVEFTIKHKGGSNWFYFYVDCSPEVDVSFGVYGYISVNASETNDITINHPATKTTYKVGETFSSEGMILNTTISSGNSQKLYIATGYATDFDGKLFTAEDVGRHRVTVFFAGKITTYEINVTE